MTAPIDLVKIRVQLQRTLTLHGTVASILHQEGGRAFWKGNVAGIYLYAVYSAVQFELWERLRAQGISLFFSGAIAATGATLVSYPFDLIRTRHSLQANTSVYILGGCMA